MKTGNNCRKSAKWLLVAILVAGAAFCVVGETARWNMFERRLGMFVHWGIYSVGGWHEQEAWRRKMSRAEYEKFAGRFTAEKFNADAFVDAAESLGAEYIVMTAKHHDGFCMWDTATTDFKVTNTPAKCDVIKELSEACRRRGMKLGFYYSNPDWHHPNAHNPASSHQIPLQPGDEPDMEKYCAYVKAQVTELLTNYGEIVCFFWDIPTRIDCPEMDALVRRLQPGIMVNDRGWGNKATCDYSTPEREVPAGAQFPRPTEACDSVGACSWGYRANEDYRTVGYLARAIDATLSRGGNFLLNVGPKSDGAIPEEALGLLSKTGAWYRRVKESYHGASTEPWLVKGEKVLVTRRGATVYVHCTEGLAKSGLDLSPIDKLPDRATILNDGSPAECELVVMPGRWEEGRRTLHVRNIAAAKYADESLVIRLDFPAACDDFVVDYVRVYDIEKTANVAEFTGLVGEGLGWKCVGSEDGKVVYIPFEGYYESKGGRIESPRFKLDGEIGKNNFYRLTFSAKCPVDGYWWVDFFDKDGVQLPDVNSRLHASGEWMAYDVVVPVHPDAAFGQIAFVARRGAQAKDVTMRRVSVAEAAKWCNDLAATLPKLDAPETAGAWAKLPKTREKILSGKRVNVVFLGDSIVNDTWCGNAVALIQSALPQADLRCFISVRGSTGCWYYHEKEHFDQHVAKYNPDLVLIGGISNYRWKEGDTLNAAEDCMAKTIGQCQAIGAEVAVCTPPPSYEFRKDSTARPFDRALVADGSSAPYLEQGYIRRAAARTGAALWDLTTVPCEAISRSGRPLGWFKRDAAHNDDRGKQLIAQTLAAYFRND